MTDEKDKEKSEAVTAPDEKEVAEKKSEAKASASEEKKTEEKKPAKTEKKKKDRDPADVYRLAPSNPVSGAWKSFAGMGAVGLAGSAYAYTQDHVRFAYSWLFGFICVLSLVIGAILLVIMHHMANAHWGIVVRRVAEIFGASSWVLVLLVVPVLLTQSSLFGEFLDKAEQAKAPASHAALDLPDESVDGRLAANDFQQPHGPMRFQPRGGPGGNPHGGPPGFGPHGGPPGGGFHGVPSTHHGQEVVEARAEQAEHAEIMAAKKWYLNKGFFYGRMIFYFVIWYFLGYVLLKWSADQDRTKDKMITVKLARFSTGAVILMTITLTFAAFDWVMALDPTWYSTIFGVTYFAGSMVCIFATLILTFLGFREHGVLAKEVTVEHYHDLGKLLFGFMCFWAYVNFAQFFLIWYAAIPEEVVFYHHRWDVGPWKTVSLIIIFFHFIIPFVAIMSRNVKRNLTLLKAGAWLLLAMHVIDIYWLVMPNVPHQAGFAPSWMDVMGFLGPVGVFLAVAFRRMTEYPIIPVGDPRLQRSVHFLNA